jgi:hypothetical protein
MRVGDNMTYIGGDGELKLCACLSVSDTKCWLVTGGAVTRLQLCHETICSQLLRTFDEIASPSCCCEIKCFP